ncbi:MAG: D-alanyl-D-alanine carboxypeptidase [Chlamydiales bacterium]|nr:D-alanyl-D-alanine carboxypeptidase [Chlamydiales bacterium]
MRVLALFCFLFAYLFAQPLDLTVGAEHAILMNAKTGKVLFEKKAHEQCHPASTTKIATALYALHLKGDSLDDVMKTRAEAIRSITPQAKKQSNYRCPPHWNETDGTHIGLKKGEEMRYYDLLHAILIASANDACNVVAQTLGGTIPNFMEGLNHHIKKLGCKNTNFNSPHGLTHPDHLTTAYDLALMAKEAYKNPLIREIIAKTRYTCPETNLEYERYFIQSNRLLRNTPYYYSKAIGMKTGTTQAAGKNLVAMAEDQGRVLIGVFLGYKGAGDLYLDAKRVFEHAFNEPLMRRTLLRSGRQEITKKVAGTRKVLQTYLPEDLNYDFHPSEEEEVKLLVHWKLPKLPILQGEAVAKVEVVDRHHNVLESASLYAFDALNPTFLRKVCQGGNLLLLLCALPLLIIFWRLTKT